MTHGEEPGPETHEDSAALTYLEGLLMHRVAAGRGATATQRCEAGHSNQEQGNKAAARLTLPNHGLQQEQDRTAPLGGATQHLKKARLLRSEAWGSEHESQRRSVPPVEFNGQCEDHRTGLNGSPQCKGESTLLASLLQSFSSRLQNVALSQQIVQSLKQQDGSSQVSKGAQEARAVGPCRGPASSRLEGLMKKSKVQNHNSSVPYHRRRTNQERLSESPKTSQSSAQSSSSESLSCAERLKAVANLVNIRSSPAPSPKPSVACSQLALLLSSEAHLQQYSREQALKAQLSGRLASERLAAMATQQTRDRKQPTTGLPQTAPDLLSSLHAKNGTPPQMSSGSSGRSPSLTLGQNRTDGSPLTAHPFRERRPFERHNTRPSQNCSSLLLHLLNNHNTQQRINGQGHLREDLSTFSSRGSPLVSDGEHSNPDSSLPKDSSDAESTHSSCSPIDLSIKNRVNGPLPVSSSSSPALDKLTESLINKWKPETSPRKVTVEARELESSPEMKPHHKVTLLQLLLDHKNNEKVNKSLDNTDLPAIIPKVNSAPTSRQALVSRCEETRTLSPQCGLVSRSPQVLPTFSHGRDNNSRASPYSLYGSPHSQSTPHSQSIPLDLCKNKSLTSESSVKEPAFSASKLLQNFAQCGKQNLTSSPPLKTTLPPFKRQTQELKVDHPVTLLERLTAPIQRNNATSLEGLHGNAPLAAELSQPGSEIENLLERRTVLQLLLGNATSKEKVGSKRKRETGRGICSEKQANQSKSYGNLNGSLSDIMIKTESIEDGHVCDNDEEAKPCQNGVVEADRLTPLSLPQRSVKQEPVSPEAIPREGLLSHLLQQQPRAFRTNTQQDSHRGCIKEEPQECQGATIPKKRKFAMEPVEQLTGCKPCGISDSFGTLKYNSDRSISGMPESQEAKGPMSPPEADSSPARCPPGESPSNDSRGFNVLKQLLLSDNCLKDLSQPRSTMSPPTHHSKLNGSTINQPSYNSELINFHQSCSPPLHRASDPKTVSAGLASNSSPGSHWSVHMAQQEYPNSKLAPIKKDIEGPVKWVISEDEKQDCQPDSPRLTKSNPILYYMLQKGNAHLAREGREGEAGAGARQCRMQMRVKEEPSADMEAFDHKLNLKHHSPNHNERLTYDSQRLNGSLKKC